MRVFLISCLLLLSLTIASCGAAGTGDAAATPTPLIDSTPPPATTLTPAAVVIPTAGRFRLDPAIAQRAAAGKPLVIRVSYHDISNEFAPFIRRGVVRAVEDFNANVELIGPVGPVAEVQIAELEQLLDSGIDGLAISSVDSAALAPIIDRYLARGIPVVTFNTDNPASKRLAFIGQNLDESGYQAAQLLAEAMGGRGDVMIITIDADAQWSLQRESGARRAFAKYPDIRVVQTVHTGTEPLEIYTAIERAMQTHQEVTGILSLDCCSSPPAGEYARRNMKLDEVKIVGFDELARTLELIEEGIVTASISQDPERQSYEAVQMLIEFINGQRRMPDNIDTGITIITAENVNEFVTK